MVSVVARTAFAAGPRPRVIVPALLLLAACTGTEHAVFIPRDLPTVTPPPAQMDAAPPPADAAPDAGREDAGRDEDAGSIREPALDRDVTFDWKQTLPGQGTCREGSYVGSFTCSPPAQPGSSAPSPLSGQVAFTLGSVTEQQVLAITQGSVKDPIGIVFHADLRGALRCTDNRFDAYTENGVSLIGFDNFDAMLTGQFDDEALVIDGEFAMINDSGQTCDGQFHVSAAP
jgi:hypothetical protein